MMALDINDCKAALMREVSIEGLLKDYENLKTISFHVWDQEYIVRVDNVQNSSSVVKIRTKDVKEALGVYNLL